MENGIREYAVKYGVASMKSKGWRICQTKRTDAKEYGGMDNLAIS